MFRRKKSSNGGQSDAAASPSITFDYPPVHTPMVARDRHEVHRAATPIELLFDLTIVVGINSIAVAFSSSLIEGADVARTVFSFITAVFSLWLSWLPYVWFASGYGTDDALFRIGTLGQMAGVLVIANGIPSIFNSKSLATKDFTEVVLGYVIARIFYIFLFRLRAAIQDPSHRKSNLKHAGFTFVLQCFWVGMLYLPQSFGWTVSGIVVLGSLEFLAPFLAEYGNVGEEMTPFHPHHIAERYSLFTIIIFGEGILAISIATKLALKGESLNSELIKIGLAGLIILFVLWWMYFLVPFGTLLHHQPKVSFVWGYTHFFIHAALVLVASSLGLSAELSGHFATAASSGAHKKRATISSESLIEETTQPTQSSLESKAVIFTAVGISLYLLVLYLLVSFLMGFRLSYFIMKVFVGLTCLLVAIFLPGHASVGDTLLVICLPLLVQLGYTIIGMKQEFGGEGKVDSDDAVSIADLEENGFVAA
ncbi:UNVERIFIED_CONTAM: hypothetical protein HDU68_007857 [Siphonaria sp. JEL0065]|nr:hypothetical protein HDU68_007857 [Siphonaria sp. JEL0065]